MLIPCAVTVADVHSEHIKAVFSAVPVWLAVAHSRVRHDVTNNYLYTIKRKVALQGITKEYMSIS